MQVISFNSKTPFFYSVVVIDCFKGDLVEKLQDQFELPVALVVREDENYCLSVGDKEFECKISSAQLLSTK